VLKFEVPNQFSISHEQISVRRCQNDAIVVHCGDPKAVKTPKHDEMKPFVLSKRKRNSFSLKVVCTGSHKQTMVHEFCVVCFATKDGSSVQFRSNPFVLTGSRDRKRKERDVAEILKAPVPSEIQNPPVREANASPVIVNTLPTSSTVQCLSRTDHPQLSMQFQETAHPNQENPPQPSNQETDSPWFNLDDFLLDFSRCRFEN